MYSWRAIASDQEQPPSQLFLLLSLASDFSYVSNVAYTVVTYRMVFASCVRLVLITSLPAVLPFASSSSTLLLLSLFSLSLSLLLSFPLQQPADISEAPVMARPFFERQDGNLCAQHAVVSSFSLSSSFVVVTFLCSLFSSPLFLSSSLPLTGALSASLSSFSVPLSSPAPLAL